MTREQTAKAFAAKVGQVRKDLETLYNSPRCTPRVPMTLRWLECQLRCANGPTAPTSRWQPRDAYQWSRTDLDKAAAKADLDRLARTYADLLALEAWIAKINAGLAKHKQDMEQAAQGAILQLKAAAAFAAP